MMAETGYIDLMAASGVDERLVMALSSCVSTTFGAPTRMRPFREPVEARNAERAQYSSPVLLQGLAGCVVEDTLRLLGITEEDIYMPALTFVFGQAQLGGRIGLISLARLKQEFYRMPADPLLVMERACKEAMHELGHTFGLTHCVDRTCVMFLSHTIQHVDLKTAGFCRSCATLIREGESGLDVKPWSELCLEDDL